VEGLSIAGLKGDDKVNMAEKPNRENLIAFESEINLTQEIPDWLTLCSGPIEKKIERDRSNLRAVGLDYDDLVDHLLELVTAVEESDKGSSGVPSKPESKIVATRLHGSGTNVLKLKLLIE
jgi:hypothetical protein